MIAEIIFNSGSRKVFIDVESKTAYGMNGDRLGLEYEKNLRSMISNGAIVTYAGERFGGVAVCEAEPGFIARCTNRMCFITKENRVITLGKGNVKNVENVLSMAYKVDYDLSFMQTKLPIDLLNFVLSVGPLLLKSEKHLPEAGLKNYIKYMQSKPEHQGVFTHMVHMIIAMHGLAYHVCTVDNALWIKGGANNWFGIQNGEVKHRSMTLSEANEYGVNFKGLPEVSEFNAISADALAKFSADIGINGWRSLILNSL